MKLMQWARQEGLSRATAYRRFHSGKLPIPAKQLGTGTILVYPFEKSEAQYVVCARLYGKRAAANKAARALAEVTK